MQIVTTVMLLRVETKASMSRRSKNFRHTLYKMKKYILMGLLLACSAYAYGQHEKHQPQQHLESYHAHHQEQHQSTPIRTPLNLTGSDVYDAIHEVVEHLKADPKTDWAKVDLEALRQHLIDMKAFTEDVEVVDQQPVEGGVKMLVKPETERAGQALSHMLKMHPTMMKAEKGWDMQAQQKDIEWEITVTSSDSTEVDLIRGLGYIGILVEGAHHPIHHWMIATGNGQGH